MEIEKVKPNLNNLSLSLMHLVRKREIGEKRRTWEDKEVFKKNLSMKFTDDHLIYCHAFNTCRVFSGPIVQCKDFCIQDSKSTHGEQ